MVIEGNLICMQPRLHQHILISLSKKPLFVRELKERHISSASALPSVSLFHAPRCQSGAFVLSALLPGDLQGAVKHTGTHAHTHNLPRPKQLKTHFRRCKSKAPEGPKASGIAVSYRDSISPFVRL